ncbi:MAG: S8 family peptidase [Acidobacteriota bacterium]
MKLKFVRKAFVLACLAVSLAVLSWAQSGKRLRGNEFPIPNQWVVELNQDAARPTDADVRRLAEVLVAQHGALPSDLLHVYHAAIRGFSVRMSRAQAQQLLLDDRVQSVEADGRVFATASQSGATWGLDRIDQRDLPLDNTYVYNQDGSGVHAYIIDTGIRTTHTEFAGRVGNGFTAIGGGVEDCNGHGTHVSGTVGSTTYGVAKNVTLHPVRVLDCGGSGSTSGVIAGVDWVTSNHLSPAVANMSLGGGASTSLDNAVRSSITSGVTYAVAAGNSNRDACRESPARVAEALTVGSTTSSDVRSSFSNRGRCVDLFAPGSDITSTWFSSDTATAVLSGTSMASPHVTGVAALFLEANPSASPATVFNAIIDNATSGRLSSIGSGSPNLLLYSLLSGGPGPGPDPTELQDGVPVSGLSATTDQGLDFFLNVPAGQSSLDFSISGGTGDADLYVKFGSPPTLSSYDCRPFLTGNNETCSFTSPSAGTWYVMVHAFSSFSGVTLVGDYQDAGGAPCTGCEQFSGFLSGTGDEEFQPNGTFYFSDPGLQQGWLEGPAGTDFDLYLWKWNGRRWATVASSTSSSSSEQISYNGSSGYYAWRIVSFSGSGNYDFWLDRP